MDSDRSAGNWNPYDGAERRRPFGEYRGAERRLLDPSTEQDHAELYEPSGQ